VVWLIRQKRIAHRKLDLDRGHLEVECYCTKGKMSDGVKLTRESTWIQEKVRKGNEGCSTLILNNVGLGRLPLDCPPAGPDLKRPGSEALSPGGMPCVHVNERRRPCIVGGGRLWMGQAIGHGRGGECRSAKGGITRLADVAQLADASYVSSQRFTLASCTS
jgi:hypothetical protein